MSFSRAGRGHSKPPGGAFIDWTHPLSRGLIACVPFTERCGIPVDLCDPARPFASNVPLVWQGDSAGYNGTTNQIKLTMSRSMASGPYSFSFVFTKVTTSASDLHLVVGSSNTADNAFHLRVASSTSFQWNQWSDDGAYTVPNMSNRRCHAVGAMDQTKVQRFFMDGKFIGNRTASAFYGGDKQLSFPGVTLGSSVGGIINAEHIYLWNRALSAEEATLLYQEPYCFLIAGWMRRLPGSGVLSNYSPFVDDYSQLMPQ